MWLCFGIDKKIKLFYYFSNNSSFTIPFKLKG